MGCLDTTFMYSDLKVDADGATFTLTNTGKMDGAEVVQLYDRTSECDRIPTGKKS